MNRIDRINQVNEIDHSPPTSLASPASPARLAPRALHNSALRTQHFPSPMRGVISRVGKGRERDAFGFHSRTSRSDPLGLRRAEAFWNFRSHGLATVVPWSVPAFLPGTAPADTSLLRSCSRTSKAPLYRKEMGGWASWLASARDTKRLYELSPLDPRVRIVLPLQTGAFSPGKRYSFPLIRWDS